MKITGFRQREHAIRNGKIIIIEETYYDDEDEAIQDEQMGLIDYYEKPQRNIAEELMSAIKDITDDYHLFK